MTQRCAECGDEFTRTDKWVDYCPAHERMTVIEATLYVITVLACLGMAWQLTSKIFL
jgi:hypothetical protein